jgi:glutamyl-tRNA synthetase
MVNFLALLGWSPGDDRELFTRAELIQAFTLDGISGGNAVFNQEKLDWINQQHLMRLPIEDLAARLEPVLRERSLWRDDFRAEDRVWFHRLIELFRPRMKLLTSFPDEARPFLSDELDIDPAAARKHLDKPELRDPLGELTSMIERLEPFDQASLEAALRAVAERRGLKPATLIHAVRVAVTGRAASPGLFEVLELLGRDRAVPRLRRAIPA